MKTDRILVMAGILLALALIFSCSSDGNDDASSPTSSSSGGEIFSTVCDIQGYRTVEINGQIWMAENLNCNVSGSKCYGESGQVFVEETDDEMIFTTLSPAEVQANCEKYGRLYNWETASRVCPSGWHLPSNEDWDKLYSFAEDGECEYYSERSGAYHGYCPTAGKNLKSDRHGFLALPGGAGAFDFNGSSGGFLFGQVGYVGYWWSSSKYEAMYRRHYYRIISFYDGDDRAWWADDNDTSMYSVRCVKD